tara:strand:- start:42 stop:1151 length:1110 start_codon:yes stop_codon:yes gene_type:complete
MTNITRKISELSQLKVIDEEQGIVQAFVNTMNVEDSDGDLIESSAFNNSIENNLPISVLHSHDPSQVIGKVIDAKVIEQDDGSAKLWNLMKFNLETQAGRDAFSNIKGGYIKEYSVGFNIPEKAMEFVREGVKTIRKIMEVDWIEVSSVVKGASPGTATLSAKQLELELDEKRAIPFKETATTDGAWNGPKTVASMPDGLAPAKMRAMFAYVNADGDPDAKSSYKFPHHQYDNGVKDASIRACVSGIAALNGARGGTNIPAADRKGIYNHLSKHLNDANMQPPPLKKLEEALEIRDEEEKRRRLRYQEYADVIIEEKIDDNLDADRRAVADIGADEKISADLAITEALQKRIAASKVRDKLIKFNNRKD